MKKALSIMFALLLLFLLPACGGEEDDYDGGNNGDGGNSDGNGGWESQEDQDYEILKTRGFSFIHSLAMGLDNVLYVGGKTMEDLYSDGLTETKKADALLVAFSAKGKDLWGKQWDVYQSDKDSIRKIVIDKQGNIYVTGGYKPALFVMKFKSDGTKIWEQFPEFDDIYSLALDEEENVYVSYRYEIVKYSTDGKELQRYNISDEVQGITGIYALTIDSKGNIYAGGYTSFSLFADNAGKTDAFLVKIAPDGTQLWGKQWGGSGEDQVKTILLENNDDIFVALGMNVTSNSANEKTDFALRISPDGDKLWEIDQQCYPATICNNSHYCIDDNQIFKYDSKGECVGNYSAEYEEGDLNKIVCDSQENVYVSALHSTKIIKIPSSEIK